MTDLIMGLLMIVCIVVAEMVLCSYEGADITWFRHNISEMEDVLDAEK